MPGTVNESFSSISTTIELRVMVDSFFLSKFSRDSKFNSLMYNLFTFSFCVHLVHVQYHLLQEEELTNEFARSHEHEHNFLGGFKIVL